MALQCCAHTSVACGPNLVASKNNLPRLSAIDLRRHLNQLADLTNQRPDHQQLNEYLKPAAGQIDLHAIELLDDAVKNHELLAGNALYQPA